MTQLTTFAQAEKLLRNFISNAPAGPYRLDRMKQFLTYINNPQDNLRVIHVAGTSGKTSTCYYLAAILRTTGATIGLTVSPHIDTIDERIQINGQPIGEQAFCQATEEFLTLVAASGIELTYFEVLMAMAFWYFNKTKVDYVVVETGLGGLLDASNTVSRPDKYCVITDIGLDHMSVLGNTLEAIAAQKAGIIQPHNQVFMNRQAANIMAVFEETCVRQNAELHILTDSPSDQFQKRNWNLALETASYLAASDGLTLGDLTKAEQTVVPGRMEIVYYKNCPVVLDGSHNPQKIQALIHALPAEIKNECVLLVSFGANKADAILDNLRLLRTVSKTIVVTEFNLGAQVLRQAYPAEQLAALAGKAGFKDITIEKDPVEALIDLLENDTAVVATGSFYLLNHLRPLLVKR